MHSVAVRVVAACPTNLDAHFGKVHLGENGGYDLHEAVAHHYEPVQRDRGRLVGVGAHSVVGAQDRNQCAAQRRGHRLCARPP